MHFFHWYEEGELRTTFEWPARRTGSTPDELNGVTIEVGLDPSGDEHPDVDRKAAVLALTDGRVRSPTDWPATGRPTATSAFAGPDSTDTAAGFTAAAEPKGTRT